MPIFQDTQAHGEVGVRAGTGGTPEKDRSKQTMRMSKRNDKPASRPSPWKTAKKDGKKSERK